MMGGRSLVMTAVELIGVAASLSLLAGWRLYAVALAAGLWARFGAAMGVPAPETLAVLGHPALLGLAGLGTVAEFFADKLAWLDSLWDALHTVVRPLGGALIALAVMSPTEPVWQIAVLLLGGGAALAGHAAKAGGRALVNTSPEPFSNIIVSLAEDGLAAGALWLVASHPEWAAALACALLAATCLLLWLGWTLLGKLLPRRSAAPPS
jgi:Domain of unknown function (DUF4126)